MSKVVKNGICRGLVGEEVSSENGNIIFRTMVFGVEVDLNLKKWMLEEQCSHEFFDKSSGFAVETATPEFKEICNRARNEKTYKNGWTAINTDYVLLRITQQDFDRLLFDLKFETLKEITGGVLVEINSREGEQLDFFQLDKEVQRSFLNEHFK